MKVSIGSDHHGVILRQKIVELLKQWGHDVFDHGPVEENTQPIDYPNIAIQAAYDVCSGRTDRAILICGTGIGMCITANKFPGVRAATIMDELTAEISRRHNDLNIICLPGDMLSDKAVGRLVEIWLNTPFDGGRHARRLEMISKIEQAVSEKTDLAQLLKLGSTCDGCDEKPC